MKLLIIIQLYSVSNFINLATIQILGFDLDTRNIFNLIPWSDKSHQLILRENWEFLLWPVLVVLWSMVID